MHFLTDLIVFKILIIWLITFWAFKEFPSISVRLHGIFKISVCFFSVDILLNIWNVVLINCNFGWWCQFTIINFDTGQNSIMIFPNSFNYGFVKLYACIIRGLIRGYTQEFCMGCGMFCGSKDEASAIWSTIYMSFILDKTIQ